MRSPKRSSLAAAGFPPASGEVGQRSRGSPQVRHSTPSGGSGLLQTGHFSSSPVVLLLAPSVPRPAVGVAQDHGTGPASTSSTIIQTYIRRIRRVPVPVAGPGGGARKASAGKCLASHLGQPTAL